MKITILLFTTLFSLPSFADFDIRVGGTYGGTRVSTNSSDKTGANYAAGDLGADVVFHWGRLGFGVRYNRTDSIGDYQSNQDGNGTQSYESVKPSSVKMYNSAIAGLLSLRFYESEKKGEVRNEKNQPFSFTYRNFGELVLTTGASDTFRMIVTDANGKDADYYGGDVINSSASFVGGSLFGIMMLTVEVGYKEMVISNTHTDASTVTDKNGNFRIGYPFVGMGLGFNF